jgi:hypothetical protein
MSQISFYFSVANNSVLIAWVLLLFWPHSRLTRLLVHSGLFSAALSLLYLVLILGHFQLADLTKFSSLAGISELFQNPAILLAGWVHYLAFDLWVGAWIARQGQELGIPHLALILILVLTFLLGPIGFLLFLVLQKGKKLWFA